MTQKRLRILHLPSHGRSTAEAMERAMAAYDVVVETCGDVYRALARIVCSYDRVVSPQAAETEPPFAAVLVAVDRLDARDFEFFQRMARNYPAVRSWAYEPGGTRGKIDLALELGAHSEITPRTLPSFLEELVHQDSARIKADHVPSRVEGAAMQAPIIPSAINQIKPAAEPDASPRESVTPVPVPWSRTGNIPHRQPPGVSPLVTTQEQRTEPSLDRFTGLSNFQPTPSPIVSEPVLTDSVADEASSVKRVSAKSNGEVDEGPLLTDEELEALLGREVRRGRRK